MRGVCRLLVVSILLSLKTYSQKPAETIPSFSFVRLDNTSFTDKQLEQGRKLLIVFFRRWMWSLPTCHRVYQRKFWEIQQGRRLPSHTRWTGENWLVYEQIRLQPVWEEKCNGASWSSKRVYPQIYAPEISFHFSLLGTAETDPIRRQWTQSFQVFCRDKHSFKVTCLIVIS